MKNKRKTLLVTLIALVLLAIAIIAVFIFRGNQHGVRTLSLEQFKQGEEYQFDGAEWNMSYKEVNRALPFALETDAVRVPAPEGITFYNSKNRFDLYGKTGFASFEFQSDALKIIQFNFNFNPDEDYEAWFDQLVTELTNLYGPESDKKESDGENAIGQFNSIVYTWETDNTMLQINLLTGNKISPNGMIGVATK